jgi:ATP-dependent Zn protease
MALGMVMQLPEDDETSVSRRQLLARLDVCMGGRVAEELIFGSGNVTTGKSHPCLPTLHEAKRTDKGSEMSLGSGA